VSRKDVELDNIHKKELEVLRISFNKEKDYLEEKIRKL
jgi:hypothetical protein